MFRFLLNFIGFLLSFVFTEKIMHEVWHLRNVIYSSIVRCHFKSIGKGGRFCYPLILNGGKNILIGLVIVILEKCSGSAASTSELRSLF